jgi:SAM-dependent methyltransferase
LLAYGGIGTGSSNGSSLMSFDPLAAHYRWLECVLAGNKLQLCRTAFLGQVAHRRRVLTLGEGNGRFLLECRHRLKTAHITCVDASSRMLELARQRLLARGLSLRGIELIHADALEWKPPPHAFDLIVTNFFLDCFRPEQLNLLIPILAEAAIPQADWLLADFQLPAPEWRRLRAQIIHRLMYAFFRAVTRLSATALASPDAFLKATGFVLQSRQSSEWGLLHADRWTKGGT